MPGHMVWVEKVVNARSVVLSYPEVAEFLQTTQTEISEVPESEETKKKRPRHKAGHPEVVSSALAYLSTQSAASRSPADVIKAFQTLNKYKLTFLEKFNIVAMAPKHPADVIKAFKTLNKYKLTFLEKFNIVAMAPKQLADILCLLDDAGLRFSKETLAAFEEECRNLFPEEAPQCKADPGENFLYTNVIHFLHGNIGKWI
uniref:Uncharacterized protein n=1 Tax=Panagrolaimus sp. JU765 TaxID=591449 RepID=A0AC34QD95_9BILA